MQDINNLCMGCMSESAGEQVCSVCGFDSSKYNEPGALPLKTVLAGRYIVGKVIGTTGEGFNYLGFDSVTESVVKITEYFPTGQCERLEDGSAVINGDTAYIFNKGIMQFIELHKKLAELADISALYRVIDIFEVNKTAYSISEHLPGISLKEFLIRNGGALAWEQVRPLFLPLISALRTLHQHGIIHGGISPETLMVGRDGRIRITDFCIPAVRNARSEMTSQLYNGFAAVEQYRGEEITPQSDVYALAATLFRTLTGNPPPDSKQRLENDNLTFSRSVAEQLPRSVLVAMANALQLEPHNRTENMDVFREDLNSTEVSKPVSEEKGEEKKKKSGNKKYVLIAALVTFLIFAIIGGIFFFATKGVNEGEDVSSSEADVSYESYVTIDASSAPEKHMSVPDFSGKSLPEILDNSEYVEWFEFKVVKKEYNDQVSKGKVCAQSVKIGTAVKKGTAVELTVSLGPETVTIPRSMMGMNKDEAMIEAFKLGLDYDNIEVRGKMGEKTTKEYTVFETSPAMGSKISPDERLIIYYNTNVVLPSSEPEYVEPTYQDDSNNQTTTEN